MISARRSKGVAAQPGWASVAARFGVFEQLNSRQAIDYEQYERLHTGTQGTSIAPEKARWGLQRIGQEGVTLGARYYGEMVGSGE